MHDLPGAGNFKSFFGTGVCFYFRHFTQYLIFTLEVFLHRQNPYWTSLVNTVSCSEQDFEELPFFERAAKIVLKCMPAK
jgi:hypothetical protein